MSIQPYTMSGTRVFIGENPVASKADVTEADFAGINWIEIKGLFNVGELGGDQTINEIELISGDWMMKSKSTRNGGTMENQFVPIALDPGQIKYLEAIEDNCRPYPFKVERGADCAPEAEVSITAVDPAVITWNGHGFQAGQPIVFSDDGDTPPAGIDAGAVYYVVDPDANTFKVATSAGGAPVSTDGGTAASGVIASAPPAGMTDMFLGLATDGARSGGGKNDSYLRTWSIAVTGRVVTV